MREKAHIRGPARRPTVIQEADDGVDRAEAMPGVCVCLILGRCRSAADRLGAGCGDKAEAGYRKGRAAQRQSPRAAEEAQEVPGWSPQRSPRKKELRPLSLGSILRSDRVCSWSPVPELHQLAGAEQARWGAWGWP